MQQMIPLARTCRFGIIFFSQIHARLGRCRLHSIAYFLYAFDAVRIGVCSKVDPVFLGYKEPDAGEIIVEKTGTRFQELDMGEIIVEKTGTIFQELDMSEIIIEKK
jgi:hypothetical protein